MHNQRLGTVSCNNCSQVVGTVPTSTVYKDPRKTLQVPWASSRETTQNAFWQRILAKSGVFCHRCHNHSHIDKNVREE